MCAEGALVAGISVFVWLAVISIDIGAIGTYLGAFFDVFLQIATTLAKH